VSNADRKINSENNWRIASFRLSICDSLVNLLSLSLRVTELKIKYSRNLCYKASTLGRRNNHWAKARGLLYLNNFCAGRRFKSSTLTELNLSVDEVRV
jgi:hypothetical protein